MNLYSVHLKNKEGTEVSFIIEEIGSIQDVLERGKTLSKNLGFQLLGIHQIFKSISNGKIKPNRYRPKVIELKG